MDSVRGRNAVAAMAVLQAVLLLYITNPSMARDHIVGDNKGWDFSVAYESWASKQIFRVGDNLIFKYDGSFHSVMEVNNSSYESCNISDSPLFQDNSGNTVIALKSRGTRYFICGSIGHCESAGMKLKVTVLRSKKPPLSRSAPAPAPSIRKPVIHIAS